MTPEQLKASILQRAMEGKLVPQNPNDEPASELLKRIKAEKEKLISEGKIKRDKKETEIFRGDDGKHYPHPLPSIRNIIRNINFLSASISKLPIMFLMCFKYIKRRKNTPIDNGVEIGLLLMRL